MEAVWSLPAAGGALREVAEEREAAGFPELYRRHGRALYGTALRLTGRPEDAEDVVQDVFLAWHRRRPDLPPEQLGRWLTRVAVNAALDRLRRSRRWRTEEFDESRPGIDGAPAELAVDLERAVARLPEKARLVFLLHDVEGLAHRELAEVLGATVGTTKSQLFRARTMLKEAMKRGRR
ncbi:MAG TPA: RNA polymerase sigma factor [Candidatus Polarisedimenticolaceae bacterium]|nr:RNA polymerase sigma factor [Candidatus Polarisedimenticolaceae bacterium]